jgi:hypothetical protein
MINNESCFHASIVQLEFHSDRPLLSVGILGIVKGVNVLRSGGWWAVSPTLQRWVKDIAHGFSIGFRHQALLRKVVAVMSKGVNALRFVPVVSLLPTLQRWVKDLASRFNAGFRNPTLQRRELTVNMINHRAFTPFKTKNKKQ